MPCGSPPLLTFVHEKNEVLNLFISEAYCRLYPTLSGLFFTMSNTIIPHKSHCILKVRVVIATLDDTEWTRNFGKYRHIFRADAFLFDIGTLCSPIGGDLMRYFIAM